MALAMLLCVAGCAASRVASMNGTWTGTVGGPGSHPVGVRFVVTEKDGKLSGKTFVQDPNRREFLIDADLSGARDGASATWTTETSLVVRGELRGTTFVGTVEYPPEPELGTVVSPLKLQLDR